MIVVTHHLYVFLFFVNRPAAPTFVERNLTHPSHKLVALSAGTLSQTVFSRNKFYTMFFL